MVSSTLFLMGWKVVKKVWSQGQKNCDMTVRQSPVIFSMSVILIPWIGFQEMFHERNGQQRSFKHGKHLKVPHMDELVYLQNSYILTYIHICNYIYSTYERRKQLSTIFISIIYNIVCNRFCRHALHAWTSEPINSVLYRIVGTHAQVRLFWNRKDFLAFSIIWIRWQAWHFSHTPEMWIVLCSWHQKIVHRYMNNCFPFFY